MLLLPGKWIQCIYGSIGPIVADGIGRLRVCFAAVETQLQLLCQRRLPWAGRAWVVRELRRTELARSRAGRINTGRPAPAVSVTHSRGVLAVQSSRIEDLLGGLLQSLPPGVAHLRQDLENNFRAVLRANLAKLDLAGRDQFDAQRKVLERTRARLEALESRVAELEARLAGSGQHSDQ
ncbi:MAG: accessory factor UbiK family protein [Proteobacteria bacterium]|nr:accessory factor UbiK family protein [Pseudomonadota bacterium]